MSDPWEMEVGLGPVFPKDIDWADVKRRIIAALGPEGVRREFASLGVHFEGLVNGKGKASCHAMDRPDDKASAFVNVATGIYHSKGDKVETLNLFDFALKYGGSTYGDWLGTVKHYAEVARLPLNARKDNKGRILEATYEYKDETGELLYQVLRYRLANGKKDFRQRRPDGRGGWIYDLEGTRRVLYRLGEVIDHPDATVFVVEGEKDADRLNTLFAEAGSSGIATTSAQGANDTGRWESYAEMLRGRIVVVIPDADLAGQRHARGIAGHLNGVAESVKVIDLTDVGPKGDASDWLDQDHDLTDLWKLVVEAPPWNSATPPPPPNPKDSLIVWAKDVQPKDVEWLWVNRIAIGFIAIFAGQTSIGKSFVLLDIIARLTTSRALPDFGIIRAPIRALVISEDPQEQVLRPRLEELGADLGRVAFMKWNTMATYTLSDIDQLNEAYEQALCPILIVIDPPANFLGGKDEHRNAEVRAVLMGLIEWLSDKLVACVFITHTNKQVGKGVEAILRIMGSAAWGSTARVAIGFAGDPDDATRCLMTGMKNNLGPKADTLAYQIVRTNKLAVVEWLGTVDTTADDAMNNVKKKPVGVEVVEWITDRFREQLEWESNDLKRLAKDAGVSTDAIFKGPEVKALPIIKRPRTDANGNQTWTWKAKDGWPQDRC